MKEASGELSMTAITVVAVAAIGVVFTTLVWPGIKASIERNTHCTQTISCEAADSSSKTRKCTYLDESGQEKSVTCPNEQASEDAENNVVE